MLNMSTKRMVSEFEVEKEKQHSKPWWAEAGFGSAGSALVAKHVEAQGLRDQRIAEIAAMQQAEAEGRALSYAYERKYGKLVAAAAAAKQQSSVGIGASMRMGSGSLPPVGEGEESEWDGPLQGIEEEAGGGKAPKLGERSRSISPSKKEGVRPSEDGKRPKTAATETGANKGGKPSMSGKGGKDVKLPPLPPPLDRTVGATLLPDEEAQASDCAFSRLYSVRCSSSQPDRLTLCALHLASTKLSHTRSRGRSLTLSILLHRLQSSPRPSYPFHVLKTRPGCSPSSQPSTWPGCCTSCFCRTPLGGQRRRACCWTACRRLSPSGDNWDKQSLASRGERM